VRPNGAAAAAENGVWRKTSAKPAQTGTYLTHTATTTAKSTAAYRPVARALGQIAGSGSASICCPMSFS